MAIKWGSTWCTQIKWGSTVCTAVYWGSTKVFPGGGYDGSSFGPPFIGGFTGKIVYTAPNGTSTTISEKTITSGSFTNSGGVNIKNSSSWGNIVFEAINAGDTTPYNTINVTFTYSSDNSAVFFSRADVYLKNTSSASATLYSNSSGTNITITNKTASSFKSHIVARFTISSGVNIWANIAFTITNITLT